MSTLVSVVPTSAPKTTRPTANFHPTLWGNRFLNIASDSKVIDSETSENYEELKETVRRMIVATSNSTEKLVLIDIVQRLGLCYHFEKEMVEELEKVHDDLNTDSHDLYVVSLRFRLLRQHGFTISCDVFEKFKDGEGKFKMSLINDVEGMLSLYEATHLSIRGEYILDEAIHFTTTHLKSVISHESQVSPHLVVKVSHAFQFPLRRSLPRMEARYFLSIYNPGEDKNRETLLKFAKLDFNILQAVHKKELSTLTRWWKDLDFTTKIPYARDRFVELYFWILGVYFEPQYALARCFLTKVIYMISIIDDTYDAYGTFEELTLFTEAVKRWNMSAIGKLPEYMKVIYRALLDIYDTMEEELAKEGMAHLIHYAKEMMKKNFEAYFKEFNWGNKSYVPTYEEYMVVALESCGYTALAANSFLGMGTIVTKDAFDWLSNNPKILIGASIINRLMDDKCSHEFEEKRIHCASALQCYMKQYGVSREEVVEQFHKEIENAWKDINEEFLKPTVVPMPLLDRVLNLARVVDLLYKAGYDSYSDSHLMIDHITSLLIDPVMI